MKIKEREYSYRETTIYKKSFEQAMNIFHMSKKFPKEETYSLTDQIRRSSRSVCINYAEGHRKEGIQPILFQNYLIVIWKIQKLAHGLILHMHVSILKNRNLKNMLN